MKKEEIVRETVGAPAHGKAVRLLLAVSLLVIPGVARAADAGPDPGPAPAPTPAPVAQDAAAKTDAGPRLDFYGFAMLDMGYQTKQNDPNWFDVVRPTKLPAFKD
jgi:hypothetical protein